MTLHSSIGIPFSVEIWCECGEKLTWDYDKREARGTIKEMSGELYIWPEDGTDPVFWVTVPPCPKCSKKEKS